MTRDRAADRKRGVFRSALGATIQQALADPQIVEVMVNADGRIWVDRMHEGRRCIGHLEPGRGESIIRLIADHIGEEVNHRKPAVSGTVPQTGERFQGQLPPITEAPVFAIRKRPTIIYRLDDYVTDAVMTTDQAQQLRSAIANRKNILVAGGTGSGKTTLANAILAEPLFAHDRVVMLEDTRELQCVAEDKVALLTKQTDPVVTMRDMLKMTLRLRPDRIVVGEVRGGEALDLLKAWNTGHPGGLATVHANSAAEALDRLRDLVAEVVPVPPPRLLNAVDCVVFIERRQEASQWRRVVAEIMECAQEK